MQRVPRDQSRKYAFDWEDEPLLRVKELSPRARLVGFQLREDAGAANSDGSIRDLEGCQVVEEGRSVGRVTSARYSPTLERTIGLAWVPRTRAAAGQPFLIRCNSADCPAVVVPLPFFDPEGKRLKS